jgi:hypothetical protein
MIQLGKARTRQLANYDRQFSREPLKLKIALNQKLLTSSAGRKARGANDALTRSSRQTRRMAGRDENQIKVNGK